MIIKRLSIILKKKTEDDKTDNKTFDIRDYGYKGENGEINETVARVTAVHRERFELVSKEGQIYAKLKNSNYRDENPNYPTVGDYVCYQFNPMGDSLILETLPRSSKFSRNDFSGHAVGYVKTVLEQVIAANFDYVFILASLNHDFNIARIERYVTLAWQSGAQPVIVLTKADLAENFETQLYAAVSVAPGVPVHAISVVTGYGMDSIKEYIKAGKTAVFLGSSGVGKSTLVNALAGAQVMDTAGIREDDSRGRHTTTRRQLIRLDSGMMIIDTPGMREMGMFNAKEGLGTAFADVEAILRRPCRFSDCKHKNEPGCAVRAALESGELDSGRYERYLSLCKEAEFAQNKSPKQEFKRMVAAQVKQMKKDGKIRH